MGAAIGLFYTKKFSIHCACERICDQVRGKNESQYEGQDVTFEGGRMKISWEHCGNIPAFVEDVKPKEVAVFKMPPP